ncbi:MAG: retropepsin-like aspartic protease [Thermodesulfobacteriota bacterium]|nr:retropepsin-like aspartic protease [Thermodesulfobacteriota bacterium]
MQLSLKHNLPFTTVRVSYKGDVLEIPDILVDTGSSSTVLSADFLAKINITPLAEDVLHTISGVGGSEVVFTRLIDYLQIGEKKISNFEIEIGGMDYGFQINGILGMDFLVRAGALINLQEIKIEFDS